MKYKFIIIVSAFVFTSCNNDVSDLSIIDQRNNTILRVMNADRPIIALKGLSEKKLELAQDKVIGSKSIRDFYTNQISGKKELVEIFQVVSARPSDFGKYSSYCTSGNCIRVDAYNYARNSTLVSIYSSSINSVVHEAEYFQMQPEIPKHLAELAVEVARNSDLVINGWGCEPGIEDSRMEATKTALKNTKCQRSEHLCVAPTFVKGDKALWAIVDLTELKVAGIKWTNVGYTGPSISERMVQNDMVMDCFCTQKQSVNKGDWSFEYSLTRSDGLEVTNIKFKGIPLYKSAKVVDWHVSYSESSNFGYSDAVGCPEFSQAAVIAIEPPEILPLVMNEDTIGFSLLQNYFSEGWPTPCSYNYQQQFEFHDDGSFRPAIASLGRGCGTDGMYRPVTRIAFDVEAPEFSKPQKNAWKPVEKEGWFKEYEGFDYKDDKYLGKITSATQEIWVEANKGQLGDGSRGDLAYVYLTVEHPGKGEGDGDLPTIGPCCNNDHRQGPEKFIDGEKLKGENLVLWYVPEIKNDGRPGQEYCWAESSVRNGRVVTEVFPCYSGPLFKLL